MLEWRQYLWVISAGIRSIFDFLKFRKISIVEKIYWRTSVMKTTLLKATIVSYKLINDVISPVEHSNCSD